MLRRNSLFLLFFLTSFVIWCSLGQTVEAALTGSISINNGDVYTTSTSVTLYLTAATTDDQEITGYRCSNTPFSKDDSTLPFETPTETKEWALTPSDEQKTVYFQFQVSIWGFWHSNSDVYSDTILLDTTAPTGSISINEGATYTNSTTVTLSLSASDANGISQMTFSTDGSAWSPWEAYATSKAYTLSDGDSSKSVHVKYKDSADLESKPYSDSIVLDTTAPTGSISINEGATYTNSSSVTLSLNYADGGSGVDKVRYSNDAVWDNETWENPTASKAWTLTAGNGAKTVRYQVKDKLVLISPTYSATITLRVRGLTVTSPNGGESWMMGTYQRISWNWTYEGDVETEVEIELLKDGTPNKLISGAPGEDEPCVLYWDIPSVMMPGTDYKIRITGGGLSDESDGNFAIIFAPSPTPNPTATPTPSPEPTPTPTPTTTSTPTPTDSPTPTPSSNPTPTPKPTSTPANTTFGIHNSTLIIVAAIVAATVVLATVVLRLRRKLQPTQKKKDDTDPSSNQPSSPQQPPQPPPLPPPPPP